MISWVDMITKIEAKNRYFATHGWLSSYHLFSFAEYYDPSNMNFGVLRVFNDDTIDEENGFEAHPHRDMEIVTIVLEGELSHQDNMGNSATIRKGEVQYMSAGTGVVHAEMNQSQESTHLYQLWLLPKKNGLTPTYGQKDFSEMEKNVLVPVASGREEENRDGAIEIQSDATIYKATLEKEKTITYTPEKGRGVFIYITKGTLEINDTVFTMGDQARIEGEESLTIFAQEETELVLLDVVM